MKKLLLTVVFGWVCASAALADFDFTISDTYEYGIILNSQSMLVTGGGQTL